ncbi:MAG: hypothetical protein DMH00_07825 [Acidobacteria bacterium]|nr:MAG: hypothetical protein DMH00_07825 [Acidobacteriota bacterium]
MKRLLVVADDLGLTPGVNEGIASAYRNGILTSASWLTNTAHFHQTLALLKDLEGLGVGIHLTLVGGRPVLSPDQVATLTTPEGAFRGSWRRFLAAWFAGRVRVEEIRAEWRAQVARAVEAGIRPAHLDSHQHLHVLPGLWSVAWDLAREFGVSRVRLPRESGPFPVGTPLSRRMIRWVLHSLCPIPPVEGPVRCSDHCFGISQAGHLDLPGLLSLLRGLPEGDSELVTHPGFPDAQLRREYRWGYDWAEETRALTSEEAQREVARLGISLGRH